MPAHSELSRARIARRSIWYIMCTVVLVVLLLGLCYGVFTSAMRASNLYILTTEGLKLRAKVAVVDGSRESLPDYFTNSFIETDSMLNTQAYDSFTITDYDYRVTVKGISVWPWSTKATVTVVDEMAFISGAYHEEQLAGEDESAAPEPPSLPEWPRSMYKLYFELQNNSWYLYQMELLDAAPSEAPKHTPDLRMSPMPVPTPTPPAIVME